MKENKQGISLIVLVITIVVMIILAAIIMINLSNDNIITNSRKAEFLYNYNELKSALSLKVLDMYTTDKTTTIEQIDMIEITDLDTNIKESEAKKFDIVNAEIVLTNEATEEEKQWINSQNGQQENKVGINIHYGMTAPTDTSMIWLKIPTPSKTSIVIDEDITQLNKGEVCIKVTKGKSYELIKGVLKCTVLEIYVGDEENLPRAIEKYKYYDGEWKEQKISEEIGTLLLLKCDQQDAKDESKYNNTLIDSVINDIDVNGKFGRAYKFSNGHIHYKTDNFKFGNEPFTIETWVKGTGPVFSINTDGSNSSKYTGGVFTISKDCVLWYCSGNVIKKDMTIDTTKWHHYAVVGNGTYIEMFLDGKSVGRYDTVYNMNTGGDLCFGANYAGSFFGYFEKLNGSLDQIAVFNYAKYTQDFTPSEFYE